MARSTDALAYWQHKTGFASSPAMQRVAQRHGLAGVGVYVTVADLIASDPAHRIAWKTQDDCEALAWILRISADECAAIVATIVKESLLTAERDGTLSCPEIEVTEALRKTKSEKAKASAAARWEKSKPSTS